MEKNMRGTRVGDDQDHMRTNFGSKFKISWGLTNFETKLIQFREWLSDPRGS